MAIVHKNEAGYLVCHRKLSEEIYGRPYKSSFFELRTPFLKDLEAAAEAKAMESGVPRVKKRKRKREDAKQLPLLESTVTSFVAHLSTFFLPQPTSSDLLLNNKPARQAVAHFMSTSFAIRCQDVTSCAHFLNPVDRCVEEEIYGEKFILPPLSELYKRDVEDLVKLVEKGRTFSFILMDPPWTNRFVKRKRTSGSGTAYRSMDNQFLADMPIAALCSEGALVAIWCTNSPSHESYLINTLLPAWGLSYSATWFWIKVTTAGNFVCPWNGPSGKHPFERIIIARRLGGKEPSITIPDNKLVVSVPCAIHSFKPPLQRLLEPFIPTDSDGSLELFARSLMPGTVSWGNQLPLLQHVNLFESVDSPDE